MFQVYIVCKVRLRKSIFSHYSYVVYSKKFDSLSKHNIRVFTQITRLTISAKAQPNTHDQGIFKNKQFFISNFLQIL